MLKLREILVRRAPTVLWVGSVGLWGCRAQSVDAPLPTAPEPPPLQASASAPPATAVPAPSPVAAPPHSAFGPYVALPTWSDWCQGQSQGPCAAPELQAAVAAQSAQSRPTVRRHGWHLWAAISSALPGGDYRNSEKEQRTNLYGVTGCWQKFPDQTAACSGSYPLWISWPNNGGTKPQPADVQLQALTGSAAGLTLRTRNSRYRATQGHDLNPTQQQTVDTPAPSYSLPPLVLTKACGIARAEAQTLIQQTAVGGATGASAANKIGALCTAAGAADVYCPQNAAICDGKAFVNQGDVMIATESLSQQAYDDVQRNKLDEPSVLQQAYEQKAGSLAAQIGARFISTKHMYWPVKGCSPGSVPGSASCRVRYGALPPWQPAQHQHVSYATNAEYLGYEKWGKVVGIDTCGEHCPKGDSATLELAFTQASKIRTAAPKLEIYDVASFSHVQISKEVLERQFTATDRALLDQAMIWAYGEASNGFEAGDFLVTVAMHVNTKELDSWALQSIWWSPRADTLKNCPLNRYNNCFGQSEAYGATLASGTSKPSPYSGLSPSDIASVDEQVGTTWRDHYLMTDSYGIKREIDGVPVSVTNYFKGAAPQWATTGPDGNPLPLLPVSANVYIEPVIHPLGTNCQNCHRRAGSTMTGSSCDKASYPGGCGMTGYQTAQCPDLLGDYGWGSANLCLTEPWAWYSNGANHCTAGNTSKTLCDGNNAYPILSADEIWLIADGHFPTSL